MMKQKKKQKKQKQKQKPWVDFLLSDHEEVHVQQSCSTKIKCGSEYLKSH